VTDPCLLRYSSARVYGCVGKRAPPGPIRPGLGPLKRQKVPLMAPSGKISRLSGPPNAKLVVARSPFGTGTKPMRCARGPKAQGSGPHRCRPASFENLASALRLNDTRGCRAFAFSRLGFLRLTEE
jgi:hypothetical protein